MLNLLGVMYCNDACMYMTVLHTYIFKLKIHLSILVYRCTFSFCTSPLKVNFYNSLQISLYGVVHLICTLYHLPHFFRSLLSFLYLVVVLLVIVPSSLLMSKPSPLVFFNYVCYRLHVRHYLIFIFLTLSIIV